QDVLRSAPRNTTADTTVLILIVSPLKPRYAGRAACPPNYSVCKSGTRGSGRAHRTQMNFNAYIEQPMATASTAFTASTETAVARNAAASTRLIFFRRCHALQSSRHRPIQAVTPASAGIGMCDTAPELTQRIA